MTDLIQGSRELEGLDGDPDDELAERPERSSLRGPVITISIVLALVVATGLTVLGLGVTDTNMSNFDASSWLFSASRGELDHVNGVTAKVDTRARIKDAQNHEIEVTQTDKYLILRDVETGQVSALDLTTLQVSAVAPTQPGRGVVVALFGEDAFVIDSVRGQVSQLDPRSLDPVGESIALPNGLSPAGFDGKGTLWIAVPTEGTVVAITPGRNGAGPKVTRTVAIAAPDHDLSASALDDGVAVLDNTDQVLSTVHGDKVSTTQVSLDGPGQLPPRTTGNEVPITVSSDRQVVVVPDKGAPSDTLAGQAATSGSSPADQPDQNAQPTTFPVPGDGPVAPAVVFAGHVYVADSGAGVVYEFDGNGKLVNQIKINGNGGPIDLEVREDHLFINAPDGSTAAVVDHNHVVKPVDKYQQGVLGADPPPQPQQQENKHTPPPKTAPGKPQNVTASAGDATVRLGWRAASDGGAPITKYVVSGGVKPVDVGANQRTAVIRGLTNGKTYVFSVHAVNSVGAGPDAQSPPVTPTADVPQPPASVTATAEKDGSVTVTWPAADGGGRQIVRYTVTSVTQGAQAPVGDVKTTTMKIPAGTLPYGTQVAFTVIAVNDKGAGSDPSPLSNEVVPFNVPTAPRNLSVTGTPDQKGAVAINWDAAQGNGRPVDKYVVTANGGKPQDVTGGATSVTINGFADDTVVTVTVHAVNEAGDGPDLTSSGRTIGAPTVTFTGSTSDFNSVSVTFTPNNHGGNATCKVAVSGGGTAQTACDTKPVKLTVGGLWPNGTYKFTVTVTTPAGAASATGSKATSQLHATVLCTDTTYCGSGIFIYSVPSQDNPGNSVGSFVAGNQFVPECHTTGNKPINAKPYGGQANPSSEWLRLTYKGKAAYFPFAWVNTDGGNNIGLLPGC
jgi:hypothetical protein